MRSRYLPRRPSPHAPVPFPDGGTYECLECEHEWRAPLGPQECAECGSSRVEWLNYRTERFELQNGELVTIPLVPAVIVPQKDIYLWSERSFRPPPQGSWRIR